MNPQITFMVNAKTHYDLLSYAIICGLSVIYPVGNDFISCPDGAKIGLIYFLNQDDNANLDDYMNMDIDKKVDFFSYHPWIEYSFTIINEAQMVGRLYLNTSAIIDRNKKDAMLKKYRSMKKWIKERHLTVQTA
ncbi:MAG: hypothetical protein IJU75_00610 [Clostridia bacterium]|nr:hypothetical protein [Clostridia bacterium]